MRRYWVEPDNIFDNTVHFSGDTFHHIFDVCRQEVGSKFEVLLSGQAYFVEVTEVGKKRAMAQILEIRRIDPLPRPYINLALCVPRFNVLENVLEKAVELGVQRIQLLSSDFSFIKKSEKISESKWERWLKIIKSSTQQSGRGDLMELHEPISLDQFVKNMNQSPTFMCLFGYEGPSTHSIDEFFTKQVEKSDLQEAWILVGAEGGFSTQEAQYLQSNGIKPVTLGAQILRVETACITLTSILKYELGLMRGKNENG